MVERQLPKLNVAGSIPVSRSNAFRFHAKRNFFVSTAIGRADTACAKVICSSWENLPDLSGDAREFAGALKDGEEHCLRQLARVRVLQRRMIAGNRHQAARQRVFGAMREEIR